MTWNQRWRSTRVTRGKKSSVYSDWVFFVLFKNGNLYIVSWNPKHPFLGCLVISNHFLCKDWESSNWNNIYKWLALGFQVYLYMFKLWNFGGFAHFEIYTDCRRWELTRGEWDVTVTSSVRNMDTWIMWALETEVAMNDPINIGGGRVPDMPDITPRGAWNDLVFFISRLQWCQQKRE